MALSYSQAAKPAASSATSQDGAHKSSSTSLTTPNIASSSSTPVKHLILDAGPLLSLTPLRHLAQSFHTTPMVLAELRDPKAREHWERLGLSGVDVKVENPSAESMARVVEFAKKTGDYAVLSKTDLSVIALTWQYEVSENGLENVRSEPGEKGKAKVVEPQVQPNPPSGVSNGEMPTEEGELSGEEDSESEGESNAQEEVPTAEEEDISKSIEQVLLGDPAEGPFPGSSQDQPKSISPPSHPPASKVDQRDDDPEEDESDGGEWITATNLTHHRNRDLGLLPDQADGKAPQEVKQIAAACMTGDFAVQNVLLGIGLGLVGEGGKRISKVKSFVLRCHACFKLCKDPSKRFCPSCGNATLLRTTVTTSAKTGKQQIHLKKNFQYHLRGSKYTIPDAKPGRAKGQQKGGTGLILREDQVEWQNAVRSGEIQRQKEERKIAKGVLEGWNDPDWLPEMITVGMSGKGRSGGQHMPAIGHGRKNPNQSRRKR